MFRIKFPRKGVSIFVIFQASWQDFFSPLLCGKLITFKIYHQKSVSNFLNVCCVLWGLSLSTSGFDFLPAENVGSLKRSELDLVGEHYLLLRSAWDCGGGLALEGCASAPWRSWVKLGLPAYCWNSDRGSLRTDVSNKPWPWQAGTASRLRANGLWAFGHRTGVCEVVGLGDGWAPGMQVFGSVVDVMG